MHIPYFHIKIYLYNTLITYTIQFYFNLGNVIITGADRILNNIGIKENYYTI